MKVIKRNMLNYLHKIQDLAVELKTVTIYYQSDIYLLNVYSLDKHKKGYKYHKQVYIDGFLSSEKQVIKDLQQIISDLEAMKNATRGKSKSVI